MTVRRSGAVLALLACAAAGVTQAHHSSAGFDTRSEVSIEGVVSAYRWGNPHVYLTVRTQGPSGQEIEQEIEAGASSVLRPLGLGPDSVSPGDRVTVRANPNRRGTGIVLGRELVTEDGTVLPLFISSRSVTRAGEATAETIEGTWFSPREGFFGLSSGRRSWQLTDAAQQAMAEFDSRRDATHAECIPVTAPTLMVYPVVTRITVDDEQVVFDVDWMMSKRIVHTDGRDHPQDLDRSLHGHSIGHWEGDTLIVDTVGFADHREGTALGIPSGPGKHLVERFSLAEDRRHLLYEVLRLEDPDYLLEPVTYTARWEYRPDLQPSGEPCDLEIAQRYLSE